MTLIQYRLYFYSKPHWLWDIFNIYIFSSDDFSMQIMILQPFLWPKIS